tara:strand:+ start:426 stop:932 length:507 start_codon:yes stop_codon:yes gene_type:complete
LKKIFGISGWSGSGKTTLMNKLIKLFSDEYKLSVCAIKHAHEDFEIDHKGKDTYSFAQSGAKKVIAASSKKLAIIENSKTVRHIESILELTGKVDIVLVEGWKHSNLNKIEVYREVLKKPLLCENDFNFVAIASNKQNFILKRDIAMLDLNNVNQIADFIINFKLKYD